MKRNEISKKMEIEIIKLSETKSQKEIALIYNKTQPMISDILKKNKIKRKKSRLNMSRLALNINYFKKIDSKEKAYWLGFICADGNINKNNNKITLVSKDLEVIESFKEAIGSGHKIVKSENFDKRTNKTYTGYSIQIGNELFTQNLIHLGITSNKTDVLEFPDIEEKYYSYFIAGLFDGDGSISWSGKNKNILRINLISTKEILNFISNHIKINYSIKSNNFSIVSKNKSNVWKLTWYGDAHRFLEFIYQDNTFHYLNRKYQMFIENLGYRENVRHFRKVLQYDKNMNLIKTWNTIKEASVYLKCHQNSLNYHVKRNNEFKNYIWKHEE